MATRQHTIQAPHSSYPFVYTALYKVWHQMIQRCENPRDKAYRFYGARGIEVCPLWHTFSAFFPWAVTNGYSKGLVLDRINTYGPYAPDNCRFVTQKENQRNKRSNHLVAWNGHTRTMAEWSEITGIAPGRIWDRLVTYGWTPERTFTTLTDQRCNERITYQGHSYYLFEWAKILGMKPGTLRYRLRAGWSVERAFSTPLDVTKRNRYAS